jgi:hypothetical protein
LVWITNFKNQKPGHFITSGGSVGDKIFNSSLSERIEEVYEYWFNEVTRRTDLLHANTIIIIITYIYYEQTYATIYGW